MSVLLQQSVGGVKRSSDEVMGSFDTSVAGQVEAVLTAFAGCFTTLAADPFVVAANPEALKTKLNMILGLSIADTSLAFVCMVAMARAQNRRNVVGLSGAAVENHNALLFIQKIEANPAARTAIDALATYIQTKTNAKFQIKNNPTKKAPVAGTHNESFQKTLVLAGAISLLKSPAGVNFGQLSQMLNKIPTCVEYLDPKFNGFDAAIQHAAAAYTIGAVVGSVQMEPAAEMTKYMGYTAATMQNEAYPAVLGYESCKELGMCTALCSYANFRLEAIGQVTTEALGGGGADADKYYAAKRSDKKLAIKQCLTDCWKAKSTSSECAAEIRNKI